MILRINDRKNLARSMALLQYLLKFAPTLDNLNVVNGHEIRGFYSTLINCSSVA